MSVHKAIRSKIQQELQSIKEKRGASKCSNMLLNVLPSLNVTIFLHLEALFLSFILSCDLMLLVYQDITCISSQNVFQNYACLAKRSQTKLLSNQGFTVLGIVCSLAKTAVTFLAIILLHFLF